MTTRSTLPQFTQKSLFASHPVTVRGQSVQLSADPKGQQFAYTNGRTVIMRNLANPSIASEYTEHTCNATVARWSPSGYYIASGDVQGNVRVWDTTQAEHILKIATRPISGRINDLQWDSESKRIICGGDGKELFGHVFSYDSGNSVGEISGHNKQINSVSFRPVRPFRAVTCSDDMTVNFYQGPPFKFVKSINDHTRFVQAVRFSPNGAHFVSAGSDGKIFLYDGSTGDRVAQLDQEQSHTGGIFAVSWSPDSKSLLTSSADSTCKIWDLEARKAVTTVELSQGIQDQQVGNLWAGEYLLSLALSGDLYYLDPRQSVPVRTVYGHQRSITAFAVDSDSQSFFTASYTGRVFSWTMDGHAQPVKGSGHTNQVSGFAVDSGSLWSIGMDDTVRCIDISKKEFTPFTLATESVPKSIGGNNHGLTAYATVELVQILKDGARECALRPSGAYQPSSVAISPDGGWLAVGSEEQKVYIYPLTNGQLSDSAAVDPIKSAALILESNRGSITALAFSPDGSRLAVADADRKVLVYAVPSGELQITQWVFHSARVNCVNWSPSGQHVVSGGLDRDIYVWSIERPTKYIAIKNVHQGGVSGVSFVDDSTILSVGNDSTIKTFALNY